MTQKKQISQGTFLKRIKDTIKHYDMLHKGDKVLVAVSGGPDSVCLLRVLKEFVRPLGIDLVVANMDHCIRGKESAKDSDFVKDLSEKLGLKCVLAKVDVKAVSRKNMSLEEKARMERYKFLAKTAKNNGCSVMATGHTMDDQAETVMMRIVKGGSPRSVAGIPPVRYEKDIKVIRPLIRTEKKYILDFLEKEKAEFVEDKTNKDPKYFRNKVRLQVLPYIEKINPQIKRTLVNFADALNDDLGSPATQGAEVFVSQIMEKNTARSRKIKVRIRDLLLQPASIRKAVFKELFVKAGGNVKKLTHRHWMDMDYFLRSSRKSSSIDLPGEVMAERTADEIVFKKRASGKK